jgi:hypothetical protein
MLPRGLLAYVLALPVMVTIVLTGINPPHASSLIVTMFASVLNSTTPAVLCIGFAGVWMGMVGFLWLVERILGPITPAAADAVRFAADRLAARPFQAIAIVALVATALATYPVLLFGRSFVAPNNGRENMLYAQPPFVPGSADVEIEDVRGSDVSAAMYAFVPYSHVQREALAQGEVPLWNRYNAAGRPLWSQGQTFLLDPLHWLTFITPDPALGWDLKFVAHRFVFALGVGVAAFVATGAWLPSAIVAAEAPFLGVYAYRLNHPSAFALTYAPWAVLAWFLLARANTPRARARAAMLLSVTMSLVLVAPPPKDGIATLIELGVAGGFAILLVADNWQQRIMSMLAAGAAGVVMALLTAPQWLTFLETLKLAVTAYDTPYAVFGGTPDAVALFLGPLNPGPLLPGLHLMALVLGIAAFTAPQLWRLRPELLALLAASATFAAIAFGVLPASLVVRIPFIRNIGHVNDVFLTAAMPLFLISGVVGAMALVSGGPARAATVSVLTVLSGVWLVSRAAYLSPSGAFEPWAIAFAVAPAAAVPWCLTPWQVTRAPMLSLAASVGATAVLLLPGGLHLESGMPQLDALLVQPRLRVTLGKESPAIDTVHLAEVDPARTAGIEWALMSGSQALYRLEGLGGPDALEVPAYEELVNASGMWRFGGGWLTRVTLPDLPRLNPLLDLLNVGFFLMRPGESVPGFEDVPVAGADRLRVGRRSTAWPRAFFADGVTTYEDAPDLLRKVAGRRTPFVAVQSTDRAAIAITSEMTSAGGMVVPADGYRLSVNTTSFHVRSPSAGVAVLGETFLPRDFRATLNGRPAPYFRVNHAFKAVSVPAAGDWIVEFEYRPYHWNLSLAMAATGLALLGGVHFLCNHSSVRRRPS